MKYVSVFYMILSVVHKYLCYPSSLKVFLSLIVRDLQYSIGFSQETIPAPNQSKYCQQFKLKECVQISYLKITKYALI